MMKEKNGFGDLAVATMASNVADSQTVGIEGVYHVECRDKDGNLKWEEKFDNLVNAVGKELLLDTFLRTSGTFTTVGPFLGLISGASPTFAVFTSYIFGFFSPFGLFGFFSFLLTIPSIFFSLFPPIIFSYILGSK
jgi:hypothetical protein